MHVDVDIAANAKLIEYLRREKRGDAPPVASPEDVENPYERCGSHPEIVERVWDALGAALPADCRRLVYGTPALVHPQTGVVLAVALGTQYGLRVPANRLQEALDAGAKLKTKWSNGGEFDVPSALGGDWVLGSFSKSEARWCREAYDALT